MAVTSKAITITPTAQQLVAPDNVRQDVQIHGKHKFFLGGSVGVTTTNGFLVDNGDEFRVTLFEGDELWGLCEADTTGTIYLLISAQT